MYQVCIISQDCEIGYSEADTLASALDDAVASLDYMGRMYVETFGAIANVICPNGKRRTLEVSVR